VKELISEAHAGGLRLGLASNSTHEWVEGQLQTLGLHHYFSFFGCRGDTPAPKPEPDIYRHVANQLGCRPVEAVALEDSFAGVRAARRAGLWVVAIPNSSTTHHTLDEAHWELPSMAELSLAKLRARFEDK
jgi:HAD superfamily hydrolase (TIGR01509 family)